MHFLAIYETDPRQLGCAKVAAGRAAPTALADLVDSSHGLALGYEAALPHLVELPVDPAAGADWNHGEHGGEPT
jgi:hypothetical protein